jgi:TetR/AcrR family transcriptional regulator, regulator of mycofactocin system
MPTVARFAARRLKQPAGALLPRLIGHLALGAAVTAYEQWLADDSADLRRLLKTAFGALDVRLGKR